MSQLEALLQQCTVKLTLPDRMGWGTGFFVAPEWILTCAHVVQEVGQSVQVQWQKRELEAVVERSLRDPYDLALLRVTLPIEANPPCVHLDEEIQSRDPLYLFGYPDEGDRQGEPRTFNCDGITGGEIASILFNLGQVRPGMSGSPLLNQRTGKVCGIVKFTRDRSIDLGGGAIPICVILEQFPQLQELQQQFHQGDRRWNALLEAETVDFGDLLARIEAGVATKADMQRLRKVLVSQPSQVMQLGKYNINIGSGQDIQIGDRTYVEINELVVQAIVEAIQQHVGLSEGGMRQTNLDGTNYQTKAETAFVGGAHHHYPPATEAPAKPPQGVPFPKVRLPENFVARPGALNAVKEKLLAEDDRTLVVSAIAGLGGLGKSVLAMALVLDAEVQARFADGILWVTLGQSPDLQTMLGEWIRELDKSRDAFSANTLESASRYLDSLLAERRMLLVVDDVWNADHAEWFRVGGAGCRVLVTTREAQIEGADYYPLDLMSEAEAIELVRQKLQRQWRSEQEAEVKAFAKVLGYLPLALNLATNQVQDGLTWAELRAEFEVERRAVALEVLDHSEAWELLDEEKQRKYSLRACFNLSLRRLKPEQLRQFSWLGVLPEDVNLDAQVASVLWNLPPLQTKRGLIDLRWRSFLTDGVATSEGERTYRVHDLMHDMARSLIEEGTLDLPIQHRSTEAHERLKSKIQNLPLAHQQFLERYRERATDQCWNSLPNDGYIHRHLTWHMQQADWVDELHALMIMSDEQGRNAWFEACDRIGQPAIFVEDVVRGWKVAEQMYEQDHTGSIVLQCRYALITATLNSLVGNIPSELMAAAVLCGYWTAEQAWAYAEQIQGARQCSQVIAALAPFLSSSLVQRAIDKARSIQNLYCQADALLGLSMGLPSHLKPSFLAINSHAERRASKSSFEGQPLLSQKEALDIIHQAKEMENRGSRINALYQAAHRIPRELMKAALETAFLIQDNAQHAEAMLKIAHFTPDYISEFVEITLSIPNKYDQTQVFLTAAKDYTFDVFPILLDTVRSITNIDKRAQFFLAAARQDRNYCGEVLAAARAIQDESRRTEVLINLAINLTKLDRVNLAKLDGADFAALLEAARAIQDEYGRAEVLSELANQDGAYFSEALAAARAIQNESRRAEVWINLAKLDGAYFSEALAAARAIQDESRRAEVLSELAKLAHQDFLPKIWEAILDLTHKPTRVESLSDSLSSFPLATFSYSDWQTYFHHLAHRRRSDLMQDLATLYPAILHLGGKAAMHGVVDAMQEICSQWK